MNTYLIDPSVNAKLTLTDFLLPSQYQGTLLLVCSLH